MGADHANPGDLQRWADLGRDPQYQLRSGRDRLWPARPVLRNRRLFFGGVLPGTAKAGVCAASFHPLCAGNRRCHSGVEDAFRLVPSRNEADKYLLGLRNTSNGDIDEQAVFL